MPGAALGLVMESTILELFEELVDFFGHPGLLPACANGHVAVVVCGPLVSTRPAAPLDREAFVDGLEVVADVSGVAAHFGRLFGAGVSELAVCTGLTVVLQDSRKSAGLGVVIAAHLVVLAVHAHPGDRLTRVGREPNVVVGGSIHSHSAEAVL